MYPSAVTFTMSLSSIPAVWLFVSLASLPGAFGLAAQAVIITAVAKISKVAIKM